MLNKTLLKQRSNKLSVTGSHLKKQVDELFDTFNDLAKLLGKEKSEIKNENLTETKIRKV